MAHSLFCACAVRSLADSLARLLSRRRRLLMVGKNEMPSALSVRLLFGCSRAFDLIRSALHVINEELRAAERPRV
jgi:hypothetical protein